MESKRKPDPEMSDLGEVRRSPRGFELVEFQDRYEKHCELQQSSLAEFQKPGSSAVWLGPLEDRMHLDYNQVEDLVATLQQWLRTGSFVRQD